MANNGALFMYKRHEDNVTRAKPAHVEITYGVSNVAASPVMTWPEDLDPAR